VFLYIYFYYYFLYIYFLYIYLNFGYRFDMVKIYDSKEKLKINLDSIQVEKAHFEHAMRSLTPASHRSALVHAIPLAKTHAPLLAAPFEKLLRALRTAFPVASLRKTKEELFTFSAHLASAAGRVLYFYYLFPILLWWEFSAFWFHVCI
jgi:hypothetical protein